MNLSKKNLKKFEVNTKKKKNMRINITFTVDTYNQIKHIANKKNMYMAQIIRDWTLEALNGEVNSDNINLITQIIREQLSDIIRPSVERLASLSAKTCIQAGVAAYLSAETIMKFVPIELQEDVESAYSAARKKAIAFTRKNVNEE